MRCCRRRWAHEPRAGTPGVTTDGDAAAPPRRRRWRRWLTIAAATLLALSLFGGWLLQPEQLVPLILDRTGKALSLEITADDGATARLRDRPQLVVRNLVVREPGAKTVLLRADRLLISLPWSSVRSGGEDATVERVELDAPVLDVPALQAWLAKRPPGEPPKIPTLTDGLRVVDGRIDNGDWWIEDIAVDLPALHPDRPAQARIRGRYLDAPTSIVFDLALTMTKPANDAGIAVVGALTLAQGDWRMPATVTLSGPLHLGEGDIAMVPARFGLSARYVSGDTTLPFALGLHGPLRFDGKTWALAPVGLALRGDEPVPALNARGALALGRRLAIRLDGVMPQWPSSWPALPAPVSNSTSPLPFALRYTGQPDLSDIAGLSLRRDATAFDGRFKLYEVLGWIDQTGGAPLPPLDGTLRSPKLEISGATLEGVEIVLDDEGIAGEDIAVKDGTP
jgi:hypothetical protein